MEVEKTSVFEVKHYDFFIYMGSEPKPKDWSFELIITQIDTNTFKACYSKDLVACLMDFYLLRQHNIAFNKQGVYFTYSLAKDNSIVVIDKTAVVDQLWAMKKADLSKYSEEQKELILYRIDAYLEYEKGLDEELVREIKLIHEFENKDIPISVSRMVNADEEAVDLEELKDDEIDFLSHFDWTSIQRMDVYQTPVIDEVTFLFDHMFVVDQLTADRRANFEAIVQHYFSGALEVGQYTNVTLNRDRRHLNKEDKKLSYLLQELQMVNEAMEKVQRLEIIKK